MQQQKVEGDLSALGFWSNSKNSMIPNPPKKSLKEPIFFSEGTSNSFFQLGNLQVIDCYLHEQ
jgi:hypothetical protein